jgi:3-hydroxyacyl-CoA dehydrogenase
VFDSPVAQKGVHTPKVRTRPSKNAYVPRRTWPCTSASLPRAGRATARKAEDRRHHRVRGRLGAPVAPDDDVLVISLKTKMHVIGDGVIKGMKMRGWRKRKRTSRAW